MFLLHGVAELDSLLRIETIKRISGVFIESQVVVFFLVVAVLVVLFYHEEVSEHVIHEQLARRNLVY